MKRPVFILALVAVAALVLSACTIIVEPEVRPPDDTRTASNNFASPLATYNVPANSSVLVRLNLNTDRPLVFIELSQELDLEVFNSARVRLASSSSASYFGAGTTGLDSAALGSQAIGDEITCRGSCVILERGSRTHVFVLISNPTGSSRSVGLYGYGDIYQDQAEPANNAPSTAPVFVVGGVAEGAIETLGDVDYWRVQGNGTIIFDAANPDLSLVAYAQDVFGEVFGPYENLDSFYVENGDILRVTSRTDRAGPSAASKYSFSNP